MFPPGGRQWKKPGNIFHVYCVYFFAIFPYAYHLGRFSPNDSVRRIHKRGAEEARLAGSPTYTLEESRKRLEAIYQRG